MHTKLTILSIDDDAADAELLRRALLEVPGWEVEFMHARSLDAARPSLARPDIDVIFLDYSLGRESGREVLNECRAGEVARPVIILISVADLTTATALLRGGADDYLSKAHLQPTSLRRAVENVRAQYVRRQVESKNRQLLEDLQAAHTLLEARNRRLAQLYDTAHEFVDHVSHEFRTPLTVIKEFASIMRDGLAGGTTDEQREYLGIVVTRVDDLSMLVDDMLDISKLEAGSLAICRGDCSVADVVERVRPLIERRAAASEITLSIDVPEPLPLVFCDPDKVGRTILNLVINAVKFCREKGSVALTVRGDDSTHAVVFSVSDNGPGIAPESIKQLFERFRQVHDDARGGAKGFGLGLSIVKELVHLGFGDVGVESELGKGSTFSFTVPCARGPLIRRYLARLGSECPVVSLLHGLSDADADRAQLYEVGHRLQGIARQKDLLIRVAPHRWVLCCTADTAASAAMDQAMQRALADANRNRPGPNLPPLRLEVLGSWRTKVQQEKLMAQFESIATSEEPVHV